MKKSVLKLSVLFTLIILFASNLNVNAQGKVTVSPSVTTRHYWRGIMVSNTANFEMDLAYTNNNFTFGAWGGYGFDNTYSEFDFHVGYKFNDHFNIAVWDLFANRDRASIDDYNYLDLDRATTNHLIDASFNFYFTEKFPLSLSVSTMLYGRDLDENGDQNYSTYVELGYPVTIGGEKISLFAGLNAFEDQVYGESFGFVNIGATATREIKITESFSLNAWAKVAINPQAETANLILGIGF
ncbi:hypothetical protein [Marinifilum sp. D714]|uniref:hypothetical protein n=1 Tax=Marinifilum sp. D714 TaxID=2937523 RepID=UPI0027C42C7D|nr:hypothetical protein [Marinifilum sp. D714]MDQ2177193.1 hypothetical protein [Marinifilum sp. D714]